MVDDDDGDGDDDYADDDTKVDFKISYRLLFQHAWHPSELIWRSPWPCKEGPVQNLNT